MARRAVLAFLLILLVFAAAFAALSWRAEIAAVEPPARSAFDTALIARGAALAAIGNCVTCHTAPDGRPYAGGYRLRTPFGAVYGTNVTPDPDTGIGRWSQAAFVRAMREGVDRRGRHLYPAFPYDHFTLATDEDLQALYAFIMTREPVRAEAPVNDVVFPFNMRPLVAGWKLFYLKRREFASAPAESAEWNRGAYLVQGLGHCGACHTPRNFLGAEKRHAQLAGGEVEGWQAPALDSSSRTPVSWTAESLSRYLRTGVDDRHAIAAGPMAPVVNNLASVPESEVRAIAAYIASTMGVPAAEREQSAKRAVDLARGASTAPDAAGSEGDAAARSGAALYAGTCAVCHNKAQRPPGSSTGEALHLALATAVALPAPRNLIRIILQGVAPPDGEAGPFMPGYAGALTDEQVAALVTYLRASFTDRPPWPDVEREIKRTKNDLASETKR